jgi:hypothetical protein
MLMINVHALTMDILAMAFALGTRLQALSLSLSLLC